MSTEEVESHPSKDMLLSLAQPLLQKGAPINLYSPEVGQTSIFIKDPGEEEPTYIPLTF